MKTKIFISCFAVVTALAQLSQAGGPAICAIVHEKRESLPINSDRIEWEIMRSLETMADVDVARVMGGASSFRHDIQVDEIRNIKIQSITEDSMIVTSDVYLRQRGWALPLGMALATTKIKKSVIKDPKVDLIAETKLKDLGGGIDTRYTKGPGLSLETLQATLRKIFADTDQKQLKSALQQKGASAAMLKGQLMASTRGNFRDLTVDDIQIADKKFIGARVSGTINVFNENRQLVGTVRMTTTIRQKDQVLNPKAKALDDLNDELKKPVKEPKEEKQDPPSNSADQKNSIKTDFKIEMLDGTYI